MDHALHAMKALSCGTVNMNEVPGFRIESCPFGGIKDSGLGIKEGVIEAVKCFVLRQNLQLAVVASRCGARSSSASRQELHLRFYRPSGRDSLEFGKSSGVCRRPEGGAGQ